jgi:hypothetical protein
LQCGISAASDHSIERYERVITDGHDIKARALEEFLREVCGRPSFGQRNNNSRLPDEKTGDVAATLTRVLADDQISVTPLGKPELSPPSALNEGLLSTIEKTSAEFWPGVPVVPIMSTGASDGSYLRNAGIPTYGHSGLASDVDDVAGPRQGRARRGEGVPRGRRISLPAGQAPLRRLVEQVSKSLDTS